MRTAWAPTSTSGTATQTCPSGYLGTQTRYCESTAVFSDPVTSNCSAIITEAGWTDDTAEDGFGWVDTAIAANTSGLGPFRAGTTHSKLFVIRNGTNTSN